MSSKEPFHETPHQEALRYKNSSPNIRNITVCTHNINGRRVTVADIDRVIPGTMEYYRVQGVAICNPEDKYDADVGERLALRRAWRAMKRVQKRIDKEQKPSLGS